LAGLTVVSLGFSLVPGKAQAADEPMDAAGPAGIANEFVKNFSRLDPIYFIVGGEPTNAKFQFSFKYRLFGEGKSRAPEWVWLKGFHLGYTQTSFWDLAAPSAPFRDTSFRPSLIYQFADTKLPSVPGAPTSYVRVAIEHESNGRDELDTRGLNTVYIEPNVVFGLGGDWDLILNARAWAYISSDNGGPNIRDFRGNAKIGIGIMERQGFGAMAHFGGNPKTGKGSAQVDVTYALSDLIGLDVYLTGQMYAGYGESLLNYNQSETRLRFGFSIVR
tara:strand:+ start:1219 stop:2043 length:825 start_codon:yes stop_codon:yes gene_type:complete